MDATKEIVDALLRALVGPNKLIAPGKHLVEDLGFDSLKLLELSAAVEDQLGLLIPVNRVAHIRTVADLYAAVESIDRHAVSAPQDRAAVKEPS